MGVFRSVLRVDVCFTLRVDVCRPLGELDLVRADDLASLLVALVRLGVSTRLCVCWEFRDGCVLVRTLEDVASLLRLTSVEPEPRVCIVVLRRALGTAVRTPDRARVVAGDTRLRLDRTLLIRTLDFWTSSGLRLFADVTT